MQLKELRLATGLRQIDVAEALVVDQAAVSKWESGETRPSRKYHEKLACLYRVPLEQIHQAMAYPNPHK